jgi:hypothetical protein
MSAIKVKSGWVYPVGVMPDTTVNVDPVDGAVSWDGRPIGYVWKGERTYSPPTHKGSRIVKYHKHVPEWHGHPSRTGHSPSIRRDTRVEVLRELIAVAMKVPS